MSAFTKYSAHTERTTAIVRTTSAALLDAPVLPSSGVDEAKLAEVIARVADLWDDPLDEVHDIPQIARAVAEWLKGQGR